MRKYVFCGKNGSKMCFVALKKCFLTDIGMDSVRKGA